MDQRYKLSLKQRIVLDPQFERGTMLAVLGDPGVLIKADEA